MDPKKEDDRSLVVCLRARSGAPSVPSDLRQCEKCKQDVFVSFVTLARIEKEAAGKTVVFACLECAPTFDVDLSETLPPSPEQLREIEDATGTKLAKEDIERGLNRFRDMYRRSRSERN